MPDGVVGEPAIGQNLLDIGAHNRAQLSRFARTFSAMLKSGVPLNQSLALAGEALGNRFLENRILEMKSAIEAGSTISVTALKWIK